VVLNYNGLNYTIECVESLFLVNPAPEELVLVDNGSTDGSGNEFSKRYGNNSRITLLLLDKNIGYAGGMNKGIGHLLKNKKIKVLLLLNNDTVVKSDFLGPLMDCLEDSSGYHIATPKILYSDRVTIWSAGARVFYPLLFSLQSKGKQDGFQFNSPRKINSVTGCAMAVRREVFEKIGLFDEEYFAYVEDIDFCKRAVTAGFRFAYCYKSTIFHKASGTLGEFNPYRIYLNVRNKAYFIKKNISPLWWPMSAIWNLGVITSWAFKALLKRRFKVIRLIFLGMVDFIRGKMGSSVGLRRN
jgi:GT2 family glycosyltransferase